MIVGGCRPVRRLALVLLACALTASIAMTAVGPVAAGAAGNDLPPSRRSTLVKEFRDELKPLGLRVQRGLLQNLDSYARNAKGTHLALYVEPIGTTYTDAEYVQNFTRLVHRFVPTVFDRWKGLKSFDICQEPVGDSRAAPPPVTQIFLTRAALSRVDDWRTADLTSLLAATPLEPRGADYTIYFAPTVEDDPTLAAARAAAGRPADASA